MLEAKHKKRKKLKKNSSKISSTDKMCSNFQVSSSFFGTRWSFKRETNDSTTNIRVALKSQQKWWIKIYLKRAKFFTVIWLIQGKIWPKKYF